MRIARARGGAGIESIQLERAPVPTPRAGEALVRLTAATLNFRDLIMLKGLLPGLTKEPDYVPLSCAAGVVVAVAEDVTRVRPGDRVSPLFGQGWYDGPPDPARMLGGLTDGVARDHAVFEAESLVLLPEALSDLEAATLPCAGLTAWSALFAARPIRPGDWVLLQGTGGVSIAALQWAKAAGARVLLTSSSDAKLARARALGADILINYRATPDWATAARRALDGQRIAVFLDVAGMREVSAGASLLGEDGVIASIGMLDGPFSWTEQAVGGRRVVPINVGDRAAHEAMLAFAAGHGVKPVVDVVYDLERLPDALRRLETQDFFGKIGITLE